MKKKNKIFNPVMGRYLNTSEHFVCALLIKQVPVLIDKWKGSGTPLPFDKYLFEYESNTPVKGVINKMIAKNYKSVVGALIALWQESDFESFDIFLEYHHTRASDTPVK